MKVRVNMSELRHDIRGRLRREKRRNANVLEEGRSTLSNPPWHWELTRNQGLWLQKYLPDEETSVILREPHCINFSPPMAAHLCLHFRITLLHFCNITFIFTLEVQKHKEVPWNILTVMLLLWSYLQNSQMTEDVPRLGTITISLSKIRAILFFFHFTLSASMKNGQVSLIL